MLQQHITLHTAIGRLPAELLMGHRLSTMLDRLHPDRSSWLTEPAPTPRMFQPEDLVFTRNYSRGPPWISVVFSRATGPVSYEVVLPDVRVLRRHVDQLRHRIGAATTAPELAIAEQQLESEPAEFPATNRQSSGTSENSEVIEQQLAEVQLPDDASAHQPVLT